MTVAMGPLIETSIRDPRTAAQSVIALSLERDALWTGVALVSIVNTFFMYFGTMLLGAAAPIPGFLQQPLALFLLIAGVTVVYVHAMYWAGLAIGGQGSLNDVLAVVVWFQLLRAIIQLAVILITLAIPSLGGLLSLVVAIWGLWVFLNFIATALNLSSAWHAIAVLVISFAGLVMGFGILMALVSGLGVGGAG